MLNQYTRYLDGGSGVVQAYGIADRSARRQSANSSAIRLVLPFISTVITLVGGTMFLMWLGEQITSRGIGNGISLIIFAGIVASLPAAIAGRSNSARSGAMSTALISASW